MPEADERQKRQDGAASGSQPLCLRKKANTIGGWLPSLTFAVAVRGRHALPTGPAIPRISQRTMLKNHDTES
jgi:hypothetical protein